MYAKTITSGGYGSGVTFHLEEQSYPELPYDMIYRGVPCRIVQIDIDGMWFFAFPLDVRRRIPKYSRYTKIKQIIPHKL